DYSVDPFKLKSINVIGQIKINSKSGDPLSLDRKKLTLIIKQGDNEVFSETLPVDNRFKFSLESNQWLQPGTEYEVAVTGGSVLNVNPARFTYEGNKDINTSLTAVLDDVPPVLSQNGIEIQPASLVLGDEFSGTIKAQDDGVGLADSVDVKLISSDNKQTFDIPASQFTFQPPGTYKFRQVLKGIQSGKWNISEIKLRDKAGNESIIAGDQIKVSFTVFADRFELGKFYFDAGNYTNALPQFTQIQSKDDNTQYFIALSYYHQSDIKKALETFDLIRVKTNYLGNSRNKEMPQMPRPIANKIWGNMLNNLSTHRSDTAYLNYLASIAEELGRNNDAKMYREYAKKQSK
ncbi:MAG: tetratricopeptide repeat protein, partial [Candidatus Poribacteria bacterium]